MNVMTMPQNYECGATMKIEIYQSLIENSFTA
jgi:hypothetical protein